MSDTVEASCSSHQVSPSRSVTAQLILNSNRNPSNPKTRNLSKRPRSGHEPPFRVMLLKYLVPLKYRRPNRSQPWPGSKIPYPKISQTISTWVTLPPGALDPPHLPTPISDPSRPKPPVPPAKPVRKSHRAYFRLIPNPLINGTSTLEEKSSMTLNEAGPTTK
jgi:hypothetical protein